MNRITANRRRRGHAATAVVVTPDGDIAALVRRHAPEHVTPRALELEALLHLPRLAGVDGTVPTDRADTEIERLARRLVEFYEPALDLAQPPPVKPDIATLEVDAVEEQLARRVTLRFHYLHSPRRDSLHFGSYTPGGRLAALVSLSRLDLDTLAFALPYAIEPAATLVLSRVFAFDWAPRNTISHLLGQVERRLRELDDDPGLLLTYVNPNLGFDGASYRAANWSLFAYETGTRYAYLGDDYLTDRELARRPTADRGRVVYSRMRLEPLTIYGRVLRGPDRSRPFPVRLVPRP